MTKLRNKGFVSLGITIVVAISLIVAGGATYTGLQYKKVSDENKKLAEQVAEIHIKNQTEIQSERLIVIDEVATTTEDESLAGNEESQTEPETKVINLTNSIEQTPTNAKPIVVSPVQNKSTAKVEQETQVETTFNWNPWIFYSAKLQNEKTTAIEYQREFDEEKILYDDEKDYLLTYRASTTGTIAENVAEEGYSKIKELEKISNELVELLESYIDILSEEIKIIKNNDKESLISVLAQRDEIEKVLEKQIKKRKETEEDAITLYKEYKSAIQAFGIDEVEDNKFNPEIKDLKINDISPCANSNFDYSDACPI